MADEINRASPRTQSALLQAMQEHHVTVAGVRHDLPRPFHVLATQNPLEQEGAYPAARGAARPVPAADRRRLSGPRRGAPHPDRDDGRAGEATEAGHDRRRASSRRRRVVRRAPIGERIVEAILDLVRAARPGEGDAELAKGIGWGPGPRAAQALMLAARARALVDGRLVAVARRHRGAGRAGAQAPHGADLRRARRRRDNPGGDRAPWREDAPMTR